MGGSHHGARPAPDAPYTRGELWDIFQFFFHQLTNGFKVSNSLYYTEYFHLLEALSTVNNMVLACDLPNAHELMIKIFRDFSQLIEICDIIALIDKCQALPSDVLNTIMAQFIDKNQSAGRLAMQVSRHVSQYFTEIIIAERDEDLTEIRTAHALIQLIQRLWAACPALLPTVIPQLKEELQAEDLALRLLVTQTLGEMYATDTGALMRQHPSTFQVWLRHKNDKVPQVQLKFVEATRDLLSSSAAELRDAVEGSLGAKLNGTASCEDGLAARGGGEGVDKKHSARMKALRALGKLYSLAYPEIENKDSAAILQFTWIPHELFQMIKVTSEVRPLVEDVVAEFILPLPSASSAPSTSKSASANAGEVDEGTWMDRLLTVMVFLDDEHSMNTLLAFSGVQRAHPTIFEHFVKACIANNGGIIDEDEEAVTAKLGGLIKYLSRFYPDPHKILEDLHVFAKLNKQRLYGLYNTCGDLQTDLKGLVKATNKFAKRIDTLNSGIAPTMNLNLRQSSLRILNHACKKSSSLAADNALKLLTFMSKHQPGLYRTHIGELVKGVADEKHPKVVAVALQALAAVVRLDEKVVPGNKRTLERIKHIVLKGSHRQAKFAAQFLAFSKNKVTVCTEVVDTMSDALGTDAPEALVAQITVLAQFARFARDAFEHRNDVFTEVLVKDLLMVPTHLLDEAVDTEEWADDRTWDMSDNLCAKIVALKTCRNRSLAHTDKENALEIAMPVLKMLAAPLGHRGLFISESGKGPKVMSRMRLQVAVSLLHLSTVPIYSKTIAPRFLKLVLVVQDTCFDMRMAFLKKLKLPVYYNVVEVKTLATSYVQGVMRKYLPEVLNIAKYIQFYLSQVANADTISLLYRLAMKGKTVWGAESQQHTELDLLSDILQPLPDSETSHRIIKTVYLDERMLAEIIGPKRPWVPQS
ncbi:hypothetical protein DFH08DRAFT_847475 [Mycena albidolilacea]|uniref:Sister chromatid cohesion protein n=1 Tax=Mycena albidolilacea TaxID=1033008 RepID=A0AAD7F0A6_9AGAR|nr:hypothetical protein DFH08DRAFT_847475 [Mycena albidolilacea]